MGESKRNQSQQQLKDQRVYNVDMMKLVMYVEFNWQVLLFITIEFMCYNDVN